MDNLSNGRWIVVVPAAPLVISLAAFVVAAASSGAVQIYAVGVLSEVFPYMPVVGVVMLGHLLWGRLKGRVGLRRPRVLASVALSLLTIFVPLAVLLYVVCALRDGKLIF